jgi:hypothetical protein
MSATHGGPPRLSTRVPRRLNSPPPSAIPTYIPSPFEEPVPVRSTTELGPDPFLNQQPTSRMNLPEPESRTGFYLYPPNLRAGVSPAVSNQHLTPSSARAIPAAQLPEPENRTPVTPRIAPPGRTHTGPDARVFQGISPRARRAAVGTDNTSQPRWRTRQAGQAAQVTDSSGQRRPMHYFPGSLQPSSGNFDTRSGSTLGGQDVTYSSRSSTPFGEGIDRASFFQNIGDATTFAPPNVVGRGVATRTVSHYGPSSSTTTTFYQPPPAANGESTQSMDFAADLAGENPDQILHLQETPSSSHPPSFHVRGQPFRQQVTESGRIDRMTVAEERRLEQITQLQALRANRAARLNPFFAIHRDFVRAPLPAQIEHFTTLPANDPAIEPECAICQEPYDDKDHAAIQLQKVNCTHVFGHSCLQQWVNSGMGNAHRCPSCRQDISAALAHAVPAAPLPTDNGTAIPTSSPTGGVYATEIERLMLRFRANVHAQQEFYRARAETRQTLTIRHSEALHTMRTQEARRALAPDQARQALAVHRDEALQSLHAQRRESEARRAVALDQARQTLEALRQEGARRAEINLADVVSRQPARQAASSFVPRPQAPRDAPGSIREDNFTLVQSTLRSQREELVAFDGNAAHQISTATASNHQEATALATRISRERAAMFTRHREQLMSVTRQVTREDREREAEDAVLRR